jgi:hypothetical protein
VKKKTRPPEETKDTPSASHEAQTPPAVSFLDNPRAILDGAVADAARTVSDAAAGSSVSREQLAAAQDILNRQGITGAVNKITAIPEAVARDAFGFVFELLGFPPIKWPLLNKTQKPTDLEGSLASSSFHDAIRE